MPTIRERDTNIKNCTIFEQIFSFLNILRTIVVHKKLYQLVSFFKRVFISACVVFYSRIDGEKYWRWVNVKWQRDDGAGFSMCQSCVCEKEEDTDLSGRDKASAIVATATAAARRGAEFNSVFDKRDRRKREERKTGRRCRREEQGTPTIPSLRSTHCFTVGASTRVY